MHKKVEDKREKRKKSACVLFPCRKDPLSCKPEFKTCVDFIFFFIYRISVGRKAPHVSTAVAYRLMKNIWGSTIAK